MPRFACLACAAVLGATPWLGATAAAAEFTCGGVAAFPPDAPTWRAARSAGTAPTGRHVRALAIFAHFQGEQVPGPAAPAYAAGIFDPTLAGSLSHFYAAMSAGQFELSGTVLPVRISSDLPVSEYLPDRPGMDGRYGQFVAEVLRRADGQVDFGEFDNDGPDGRPNSGDDDGVVDYLFIIVHSSPRGFIRGSATGIAGLGLQQRSRIISLQTEDAAAGGGVITISGSTRRGSVGTEGTFTQTVGVMAHEYGHALGLPDLYDLEYDGPEQDSAGIGNWGLMGRGAHGWNGNDGPNAFSAWSLERLGWLGIGNARLHLVRDDVTGMAMVDPLAGGVVLKIPVLGRPVRNEYTGRLRVAAGYLLVERRTRFSHYNRAIPGEGVLVWWVNPDALHNGDEGDKLVDLVCADGLYRDRGAAGQVAAPLTGRDDLDFWAHDAAYRRKYGGNLGDASDPFDGRARRFLRVGSNPDIGSLADLAVPALVPPEVRVVAQGEELRVSVGVQKWAGEIDEEIHWRGEVQIAGDIVVTRRGRLSLYPGTRVRVAAADSLRSGLDPRLIELRIDGGLEVLSTTKPRPVVFEALRPGSSWRGVILGEQPGPIQAPTGALRVLDATHGIDMAGRPPGAREFEISAVTVDDRPAGEGTAGNGDGRLQAGESVRLSFDLRNWSLTADEAARFVVTARNAVRTWPDDGGRVVSLQQAWTVSLAPASRRRIELPSLTLDRRFAPGDSLLLSYEVTSGIWSFSGEFGLPVAPDARPGGARMWILDQEVEEGPILFARDERLPLRVWPAAAVTGVELLLRPAGAGAAAIRQQALRRAGQAWEGEVAAAAARGTYDLRPRIRFPDGTTRLGPHLRLTAAVSSWEPALIIWGGSTFGGIGSRLARALPPWLESTALNLPRHGLDIDPITLSRYQGADRLVIWGGGTPSLTSQARLAAYVEAGGRLLLSMPELGDMTQQLRALLPFDSTGRRRTGWVEGSGGAEVSPFLIYFRELQGLSASAQVFLRTKSGAPAAAAAVAGDGVLAFMPFELSLMKRQTTSNLLAAAIPYLQSSSRPPAGAATPPPHPRIDVRLRTPVELLRLAREYRSVIEVENKSDRELTGATAILRLDPAAAPVIEQSLPPIAPGRTARVLLQGWRPSQERDYARTVEVRAASGALLDTARGWIRVADIEGYFALEPQVASTRGNGAAAFDADGDGRLDLYVVRLGESNALHYNRDGLLLAPSGSYGLDDDGQGRGATVGDFDGDGDLDLYLVNEGANHMYRNEAGFFQDVTGALTAGAAPLGDRGLGRSAAFFDHDGDGDLDLYLVNAYGTNRLFEQRAGRFEDVAAALGVDDGGNGRGLAVGDIDRDGDEDLFVTNQGAAGSSQLYLNTPEGFAPMEEGARPLADRYAVAATFGDHDGDGDLDLFITSERGANQLWRNDGDRFTPPPSGEGPPTLGARAVGAAFLDYDNDGDLDIVTTGLDSLASGDEIYHNRGSAGFVGVGRLTGLQSHSIGRGLAYGDFDGDGLWEFAVADIDGTRLYRSRIRGHRWLDIALEGPPMNLDGLGSRVQLRGGTGRQSRWVRSGDGYGSTVQPLLHFGLGRDTQVGWVTVTWPDGQRSASTRIVANQRIVIQHPQAQGVSKTTGGEAVVRPVAHPNPFNGSTTIDYQVEGAGQVELQIFNALGQRVRRLVGEDQPAGVYRVTWDGRDDAGRQLASGVYLYRLTTTAGPVTRRLVMLR